MYMVQTLPQIITDQKELHQKSQAVFDVNSNIQELVETMFKVLEQDKKGVGLAAPQIGKFVRLFVVDLDDKKYVFTNPRIIKFSDKKVTMEEGCLSVPGVFKDIERPAKIAVEALDSYGKKFKLKTGGILARVIQHENDHLEGVLIIDK